MGELKFYCRSNSTSSQIHIRNIRSAFLLHCSLLYLVSSFPHDNLLRFFAPPVSLSAQMKITRKRPILEISNLRIQRGPTVILDDISWRVCHQQHWVILGANGSGKTSLLSALTGYLMPTNGEISVLGESYGKSDWRELRKHI